MFVEQGKYRGAPVDVGYFFRVENCTRGGVLNTEAPNIQFVKSSGAMLPLVESYYLYRFDSETIEGVDRVDMGQIRFMLKGKGTRTFPDGHLEASCPVMINPAGTAAASYRIEGPFHCFGVSLRAIGWKSLIGLPNCLRFMA